MEVPLERVRSLAQEEGVDPYHLDLVLLPLYILFEYRNSAKRSPGSKLFKTKIVE